MLDIFEQYNAYEYAYAICYMQYFEYANQRTDESSKIPNKTMETLYTFGLVRLRQFVNNNENGNEHGNKNHNGNRYIV